MKITEIAEDVVKTWESIEGEAMRDGHRSTLIACIATALRDERDGLFQKKCFENGVVLNENCDGCPSCWPLP